MTMCPIHNVEMAEREGQYGVFYSHKVEVDPDYPKGWCNGKKPKTSNYEFVDEPARPSTSNPSSPKAFRSSIGEQEQPDWDAINRGKVRCQVAVAFIRQGQQSMIETTIPDMEEWVDYIMSGPKGESER